MAEFLESISLLPVVLTLGAYQIGMWLRKKWDNPIVNPLLIAVVLVVGFLLLTGISPQVYGQGTQVISWLLTPITVCLALPLYRQVKILRKSLPAILAGVAAGAVTSLVAIFAMCKLFDLDGTMTVSMLPKSATSAMSMALSAANGGLDMLTTAASVVTGIQGALMGPVLCKLFRIQDPIAQGVAFGTSSHVIGTTKATEIGPLQGAVSSLSLAVAGTMTAVLFPLAMLLVK